MGYLNKNLMESTDDSAFRHREPFPWLNPEGFITDEGFAKLLSNMPEPELFDADPALELPPLRPLEDELPPPAQDSVDAAELDAAISSLIDELEGNR